MSREPMDPGIEALLNAERSVDALPDAMHDALKAATFAKLGLPVGGGGGPTEGGPAEGGPAPATGSPGATEGSATAGAGGAGTAKLALTALVSGALGLAIGTQLEGPAPELARLDPLTVEVQREPAPIEEEAEEVEPEPETVPEPEVAPRPRMRREAREPSEEPATPAQIRAREERILIDRARAALGAGDYRGVFRTLLRHESEHAGGAMVEEREALRVRALAASGETDRARRALERFESRFPASPLRARLRREVER